MNVPHAQTDALFPAVRRLVAELEALPGSVAEGLAVEGLLEEREGLCLYGLARRSAPLGAVVEIGSYKGRSTWFLARGLEDVGSSWPVVAFDPHLEGTRDDFHANLARTGIASRVEPHAAFSHDEAPAFDRPIGLLWIDGDHTYAGVRRDFEYPRGGGHRRPLREALRPVLVVEAGGTLGERTQRHNATHGHRGAALL